MTQNYAKGKTELFAKLTQELAQRRIGLGWKDAWALRLSDLGGKCRLPRAFNARILQERAAGRAVIRGIKDALTKAEHLLPEFKSGKPPVQVETLVRVGTVGEHGQLTVTKAIYDPADDTFCYGHKAWPREPEELWLLESEYEAAFSRAADRAGESGPRPSTIALDEAQAHFE